MKSKIAQKNSFAVDVEEGKNLLLMFTCESKKQPLCDGSHKNSLFNNLTLSDSKTETDYLCTCKDKF